MIVYVAGPYFSHPDGVSRNIENARKVAIELWEAGHVALTPHLNTAHFERDCTCTYEDYLRGDLQLLLRCDAVVMLQNWKDSPGASGEYEYARKHNIPIYIYPDLPPLSLTELTRPLQAEGYMSAIMQGYRTHLEKNADYSPANIAGTGHIGLGTRTWDKVSRLVNLFGFNVEVEESHYSPELGILAQIANKLWYLLRLVGFRIRIRKASFAGRRSPKNESIEDNIMDLHVYSLIWMLYRRGVWGK